MLISLVLAEQDAMTHLSRALEDAESAELALRDSWSLETLARRKAKRAISSYPLLVSHQDRTQDDKGPDGDDGDGLDDLDRGDETQLGLALAQQAARLARRQLTRASSSSRRLLRALVDLDFTECYAGLSGKKAILNKEETQAKRLLDMFTLVTSQP